MSHSYIRVFIFLWRVCRGNRLFSLSLHHFIFHFRHDEQIDCECFLVARLECSGETIRNDSSAYRIQKCHSSSIFYLSFHMIFSFSFRVTRHSNGKMDSVEVAETAVSTVSKLHVFIVMLECLIESPRFCFVRFCLWKLMRLNALYTYI